MKKISVIALISVILVAFSLSPRQGDQAKASVRAASWSQNNADDFNAGTATSLMIQGGDRVRLVLEPGEKQGEFLSEIKKADFSFNAVGVRWIAEAGDGDSALFDIRTSDDGQGWTDWMPVQEMEGGQGDEYGVYDLETDPDGWINGDLVFASGHFVQYRVTLRKDKSESGPAIKAAQLTFIDSAQDIGVDPSQLNAMRSPVGAVGKPNVISRAGWGSSEPNSSVNWPPEYRETKKVIVHHTVTRNNDSNPAATIRAIWYYHSVTLGWGDIGYNFLVDTRGNIYEGRYGGLSVVGGHATRYNWGSVGIALLGDYHSTPVPATMQQGLTTLLTWLSYEYGINPNNSSYFIDKTLPNIMGHRDSMYTICPGNLSYNLLPSLRSQVWSRLPKFGEGWGRHNTPSWMGLGQTQIVDVDVFNRGTTTWNATGRFPFRLGYHWIDEQGRQYLQDSAEDIRSDLPTNLIMGQKTTVQARIVAPRRPGTYTLKWDIVQEGIAWMEGLGETPLTTRVMVSERPPTPTPTPSPTPGPATIVTRPKTLAIMAETTWPSFPVAVRVDNAGRDSFTWTASVSGDSWFSVSPLQGNVNGEMVVTFKPRGLGAGTYEGAIVINTSPSVAGSPYTIPVQLQIVEDIHNSLNPKTQKEAGRD